MFHDKGSAVVCSERFPGHSRHKKCICNRWNHQTTVVDMAKCHRLSPFPANGASPAQKRAIMYLTKHNACSKQIASGKALSYSVGVELV